MSDNFQQILSTLIAEQGLALCDDVQRCTALLRDYAPAYHYEIPVVVKALEAKINDDLVNWKSSELRDALLVRLTKRLRDMYSLPEAAARYAVESWAFVLGVISSNECITRFPHVGGSAPSSPSSTPSRSTRSGVQLITCATCSQTNPSDEIYCQHCANQLSTSSPCPYCQRLMPENTRFCPECGRKV